MADFISHAQYKISMRVYLTGTVGYAVINDSKDHQFNLIS